MATQETTVSQVVVDCPWEAVSMEISDLLMSQRRWGRARCRRLLLSLGLPENKQIGTLTQRQRMALAAVLGTGDTERDLALRGVEHRLGGDRALVPA